MRFILSCLIASALSLAHNSARAAEPPDFNREVRPILSRYCFKCHGPDDKSRKGKLRLDLAEAVLKEAKSGAIPIVPGKADESEVTIRLFSTDDEEIMPPPSAKMEMSATDRETIKRWIAAGAKYEPHWAFIPPKAIAPPNPASPSENPVDSFIHEKLRAAGLSPSPTADRYTLIRRVSFDLTGLPPTPGEVEAFVSDQDPQAYHHLVDRLIASSQYGERWARQWLDLARYADSNGYEKDRTRSIWPYRDWVVRALNADMPFDQFTVEQIAGDLLPNTTRDQLIATGFHRNTMLNEEGGIDPLEFRYNAMTDRVATTGTTWLGLTVGCAQCHTHKFDPITHREYFGFMAFLDNADEPDLDILPADAELQKARRITEAARLLAELPTKWPLSPDNTSTSTPPNEQDGVPSDPAKRRAQLVDDAFKSWLQKERARSVTWKALHPTSATSNLPLLTVQPDESVFASGDITKSDTYQLTFATAGSSIAALRLEVLPDDRLPAHGPGMTYYEGPKGDFFLGEFQVIADGKPVKFVRATESHAGNAMGATNPVSAALATDGDPQTGWSCAERIGQADEAVFIPEKPITAERLEVKMLFGRHYACSLGRFRIAATSDSRNAEARTLDSETQRVLSLPDDQLTTDHRISLRNTFLLKAPELAEPAKAIRDLQKSPSSTTSLILRERPANNPRPTFLRRRGEFTQPEDRIDPAVLSVLNPLPSDAPRNRLTFARWLVTRENPLTARVVVNRAWAAFFGRGLVKTQADFGYQGEVPSHPALLDWLAVDLMEKGWSMKKLHRLIVTSATYQQASVVIPDARAKDPDNRLLSYFPRTRLEAEMIRDGALKDAGLLSLKMGGPPVRPPQAEGISEVAYGNPKWDASAGEDRFRRSLYTFVKRTAPFALYNTFDAPTGEACIARRDVSDTPLQALSLLNDITFQEVSQSLGRKLAQISGDDDQRLRSAIMTVLNRPARDAELFTLRGFLSQQRERFGNGELSPQKFAGADATVEQAAWVAIARALLNLDETITKS